LLLAAVRPNAPSPDWTQFRLDRGNNARVPGTLEVSWQVRTNGGFSSSPIVHDGRVYVGNNTGDFYAIDARTGTLAWTRHFSASLMAAPILYRNTLVIGEGNQEGYTTSGRGMAVGSGENALIGVDPQTGRQRWRYALAGTGMPTSAVIAGTLVQHDGAGIVHGLDPQSGAPRFSRDLGGIASMSAVLPAGGDRFVTVGLNKNAMWELRASDGAVVWEHDFDTAASGVGDCPPASDGERAFCDYLLPAPGFHGVDAGGPAEMHAYAVALADGSGVWDTAVEIGTVPMWNEAAIPLAAGDTVYLGSAIASAMHALDAATGRVRWQTAVRGAVKGGPVLDDGVLYFGDLAGYLWALDAEDGHVIGVKNVHVPFNVGSPVIFGQTLFIGGKDGTFLAIPLAKIRSGRDR
jgi:outer membrane protein assembly factor BamB